MLVAVIHAARFFGATPAISSVSGGTGGTWTQRAASTVSELATWIYTCAGNPNSSVTLSVSGTWDGVSAELYELDANASDFDVKADGASGSGTAVSSGTTGTLASDEGLAIGGANIFSQFNSFTAGGGFTEDFDYRLADTDVRVTSSHLEVTSTSGVAATYTAGISGDWTAAVIVIKPAGGGGATTRRYSLSLTGVG